jgi:hypothetical protein
MASRTTVRLTPKFRANSSAVGKRCPATNSPCSIRKDNAFATSSVRCRGRTRSLSRIACSAIGLVKLIDSSYDLITLSIQYEQRQICLRGGTNEFCDRKYADRSASRSARVERIRFVGSGTPGRFETPYSSMPVRPDLALAQRCIGQVIPSQTSKLMRMNLSPRGGASVLGAKCEDRSTDHFHRSTSLAVSQN